MSRRDKQQVHAVIERCVAYGDHDLVVHLYGLETGRASAYLRRGRSQKSRFRARVEPFAQMTLTLVPGKGDLWSITDARDVVDRNHLRSSHAAQQYAAVLLDLLWRTTVEGEVSEAAFHVTHRALDELDRSAGDGSIEDEAPALVAAHGIKMLVALGMTPELGACVRTGTTDDLVGFSARDGGAISADAMAAGDITLDASIAAAAAAAIAGQMGDAADAAEPAVWRKVWRQIVAPMYGEHAGVRPKDLPRARA